MVCCDFDRTLTTFAQGLHTDFACHMFSELEDKPPPDVVTSIVSEAVAIEKEFLTESLPVGLLGMNATKMAQVSCNFLLTILTLAYTTSLVH